MTLDMSHWRSLSRGEEIEVLDDASSSHAVWSMISLTIDAFSGST
jgi:hypothetical protein